MRTALTLLTIGLLAGAGALAMSVEPEFDDPRKQALYDQVTNELRCLVCQNQTIADSNASLAQDLRVQVKEMIDQGAGYDEIMSFMTARYGDFVRYRPPWTPRTWLLWLAPVLLMLLGAVVVVRIIRQQAAAVPEAADAASDAALE